MRPPACPLSQGHETSAEDSSAPHSATGSLGATSTDEIVTIVTASRMAVLRVLQQETGGWGLLTPILFRQRGAIVHLSFNHSH